MSGTRELPSRDSISNANANANATANTLSADEETIASASTRSKSRRDSTIRDDDDDDSNYGSENFNDGGLRSNMSVWFREWRHNRCLMCPTSALLLSTIGLLSFLTLIFQLPQFFLGLLMAPLVRRGGWLVEFLYPTRVVGWGHIQLVRWAQRQSGSRRRKKTSSAGNHTGRRLSNGGSSSGDVLSGHSRTLEQRVEVVKGRVFVHAIPVLLDNVAYLIVYVPPGSGPDVGKRIGYKGTDKLKQSRRGSHSSSAALAAAVAAATAPPLLGIVVDCGDADDVADAVVQIRRQHYQNRPLYVTAILSTHKHHDHTAGNKALRNIFYPETLHHVYGGAVERVPECTDFLRNGDFIPLPLVPSGSSDDVDIYEGVDPGRMSDFVEIEVIAAPSHTRGSVIFALRNKPRTVFEGLSQRVTSFLFTGDAMFCAGGGVPFEADLDSSAKGGIPQIRPGAGLNSVERCFAEVLARTSSVHDEDILIFPGHEYTNELMQRQFDPRSEFGKGWHAVPPSTFFEAASQLIVARHRRTLPRGMRALTVPSPISRELKINPHFRSLATRGQHILNAVEFWKKHYCPPMVGNAKLRASDPARPTVEVEALGNGLTISIQHSTPLASTGNASFSSKGIGDIATRAVSKQYQKTASTKRVWTLSTEDVKRDVFATVYASDLRDIINDLRSGTVDNVSAADRLAEMTRRLDEPVLVRRPLPGTLPSDKSIQLGLLALAILGSPPAAMAPSDGEKMNLPLPQTKHDRIRISKSRLLNVLRRLGLIDGFRCEQAVDIDLLWRHALASELTLTPNSSASAQSTLSRTNYSSVGQSNDLFSLTAARAANEGGVSGIDSDECELGLLKIALYGISPSKRPFWSRFCRPCRGGETRNVGANSRSVVTGEGGGSGTSSPTAGMKQSSAEVIRHESCSCFMCREVVGCPRSLRTESQKSELKDVVKQVTGMLSSPIVSEEKTIAMEAVTAVNDSVEMEVVSFSTSAS